MKAFRHTIMALGIFLGVAAVVAFGVFVYTGFSPGDYHSLMHGGLFPLHAVGMVIFWGLILALLYTAFKETGPASEDDAERAASRRYARGEIDKETYLEIKRTLRDRS